MIHVSIILAVLISAFIEGCRIEAVKGQWVNIPKFWTYIVQSVIFGIVLWVFKPDEWYLTLPEMACIRGLLYDPVLNRLRGLKWDYVSERTNSWLDRLEAKIKALVKRRFKFELTFISERIVYGLLALIFLILYEWL